MRSLIKSTDLSGADGARSFTGAEHGDVPISMFLVDVPPGEGPGWHRHPYPEVFVVHAGTAAFGLGHRGLTAAAGDVVIAPAGVAHRFAGLGSGHLRLTAIHTAPAMETEWLTDRD